MAKRQRTTGQPNRQRQSAAQQNGQENASLLDNLLGNPKTRQEREEAINQLLIRSIVVSGIVIAVLIAIALIWDQLIVPARNVATVNGETISVSEFRDRIGIEQVLVAQEYQGRLQNAQTQAAQFGVDVNQILQNDQRFSQLQGELGNPDLLALRVVDDMVNELLVEQALEERSITVDDAAIEDQVNNFFGYDPTAVAAIGTPATETPTPTITPTPFVSPTPTATPTTTPTPTAEPEATAEVTAEAAEATEEATEDPLIEELPTLAPSPTPNQEEVLENFEQQVEDFRENVRNLGGVGNATIDNLFQTQAQQIAMANALMREEPYSNYLNADALETTFVSARHILVEEEAEAQQIIEALNSGASFAALARANSTDTGSGGRGGELGWSAAAGFVPPFRDAVLDEEQALGTIIGPVESEFGFHIIQVRARETREVGESRFEQFRDQIFANWVEEIREAADEAGDVNIVDNIFDFVN